MLPRKEQEVPIVFNASICVARLGTTVLVGIEGLTVLHFYCCLSAVSISVGHRRCFLGFVAFPIPVCLSPVVSGLPPFVPHNGNNNTVALNTFHRPFPFLLFSAKLQSRQPFPFTTIVLSSSSTLTTTTTTMSSLRNAVKRIAHKERSQPVDRQHPLG